MQSLLYLLYTYNFHNLDLDQLVVSCQKLLADMQKISPVEIELMTREQSDSTAWVEERRKRLTASRARGVTA
jgi:hypothetical protein